MSRCLFDVEHETECKRDEVDQHPHLSFVPPNHAGVVSEHMFHIKLSAAGAVKIVVSQMTTESMLVACRKLGRILFMFFFYLVLFRPPLFTNRKLRLELSRAPPGKTCRSRQTHQPLHNRCR
jgi:hypothetical protein